jgi:prolipoprotein diacylglyceryltransferase
MGQLFSTVMVVAGLLAILFLCRHSSDSVAQH